MDLYNNQKCHGFGFPFAQQNMCFCPTIALNLTKTMMNFNEFRVMWSTHFDHPQKWSGCPRRQMASSGLQPSSRPFCSSCASWTNWSVSCSPSGPGNWSKWNQKNPKRLEPRILERFGDFGVNTRGSSNTCEWMCPTVINSHSHQKENDSETSRIQRKSILRNQPKLNPGHNFLHLRSLTSPLKLSTSQVEFNVQSQLRLLRLGCFVVSSSRFSWCF